MSTMVLRENMNVALEGLQSESPDLTLYQIAKQAKTNYSNLKDAFEGRRVFSDTQLKELSISGIWPVEYERMRRWKLMDEYPEMKKELLLLFDEKTNKMLQEIAEYKGVSEDQALREIIEDNLERLKSSSPAKKEAARKSVQAQENKRQSSHRSKERVME